MIRTWVADISALYEESCYDKYYKQVPEHRKGKADHSRFQGQKAQSVGAWVLYERMLEHYSLTEARDSVVFNLSHSGDYVLCSLEDGWEAAQPETRPGTGTKQDAQTKQNARTIEDKLTILLGCDIETIKEVRMKVAHRFFCDSETAYIERQKTEDGKALAFYRYWVLKESFMKATRLGMGLDTRAFEIAFDENDAPQLIRQPEEYAELFYYKEYVVEGVDARIAVCSTHGEFGEIRKYEIQP